MATRSWRIRLAAALAAASLTTSCGLGSAVDQATAALDRAVSALDGAITKLANESADWKVVLQDTIAKLTEDAQRTIRNELSDMLNRGIAAAGVEIRCNVDFMRTRIRQELARIRARLLGRVAEEREPQLCSVVPLAVDRERVPQSLKVLEFYGYDFDTTKVQVMLFQGDGSATDVSTELDRPTHYHMTLNLGPNGVQLRPDSRRFVLRWKDKDISTISIVSPNPPKCQTRTDTKHLGPYTFNPPRTRGDGDFAGHGPRVWVDVSFIRGTTTVSAKITMTARETESDYTTAAGTVTIPLYNAPPGTIVEQLVGGVSDSLAPPFVDADHTPDELHRPSGGPVQRYVIVGDTGGDEAGTKTGVTVHFNPLQVSLRTVGNCV